MQETIGNDTVEYHGVRFVVKINGEVGNAANDWLRYREVLLGKVCA